MRLSVRRRTTSRWRSTSACPETQPTSKHQMAPRRWMRTTFTSTASRYQYILSKHFVHFCTKVPIHPLPSIFSTLLGHPKYQCTRFNIFYTFVASSYQCIPFNIFYTYVTSKSQYIPLIQPLQYFLFSVVSFTNGHSCRGPKSKICNLEILGIIPIKLAIKQQCYCAERMTVIVSFCCIFERTCLAVVKSTYR